MRIRSVSVRSMHVRDTRNQSLDLLSQPSRAVNLVRSGQAFNLAPGRRPKPNTVRLHDFRASHARIVHHRARTCKAFTCTFTKFLSYDLAGWLLRVS